MDDLLSEFLTETAESLATVDSQLVRLEADPGDRAVLDRIFRLLHSIKGAAGFLDLPRLAAVTHAGETLLGRFREGLPVTPEGVSLALAAVDRVRELLRELELFGVEPPGDDGLLIARLDAASLAEPDPAPVRRTVQLDAPASRPEESLGPQPARAPSPDELSMAELEAAFQAAYVEEPAPPPPPAPAAERAASPPEPEAAAGSIRVGVEVLDDLMTRVGELVLTRNQLLQMVRTLDDSTFKAPLQRLSVITGELQESVLKTRMQPVEAAWKALPRLVRDLSRSLGKRITLATEGGEVELDRQVLERIKDPLTHLVRNSADHGLETPEERRRAGKPEAGILHLSARQESGFVVIRIADDGRGLDTTRIRDKAVARGLVGRATAAALSDDEVHRFIFSPGFSTAEAVTSVSGRGVGMDVVRTEIEAIGGEILVQSAAGSGAAFALKIPLSLAIASSLVVGVAGQRFALPQIHVQELVRTGGPDGRRLEFLDGAAVLRLRDRLLPVLELRRFLRLPAADAEAYVVVMQVGGRRFGLAVGQVFDTEEIVVKPLARVLREVKAYAGATLLGDGSVVMILEPAALAGAVGELEAEEAGAEEAAPVQPAVEKTALLLVRAGAGAPKAVPLSLISRLEDVPAEAIEHAGGRALMRYGGGLAPVIALSEFAVEGAQPVLVFADGDQAMGLAVDEVLDIVEAPLRIETAAARPGVLGSALLAGRATEVLDVGHWVAAAHAGGLESAPPRAAGGRRRVLLVDDNAFFRNMIAPLLSAAGYQVTSVASAEEAWRLHTDGSDFDAVVSDVEAGGGRAFAARVRDESRWADAPLIALTGLPPEQAAEAAPEGSQLVRKSDRDGLIATLARTFRLGTAA